MRVTRRLSGTVWLLFALTTLAVTAVVHIVTVLALPYRAPDDAFSRIARVTPLMSRTLLQNPASGPDRIPFHDPAMAEAVCRYDLRTGALRLSIGLFNRGFLSIGIHSRRGLTFYGLIVRSIDATALDLVLLPVGQNQPAASDRSDEEPNRDVIVAAPEPEGFVTIQTPIEEGEDPADAADILSHVRCSSEPRRSVRGVSSSGNHKRVEIVGGFRS